MDTNKLIQWHKDQLPNHRKNFEAHNHHSRRIKILTERAEVLELLASCPAGEFTLKSY